MRHSEKEPRNSARLIIGLASFKFPYLSFYTQPLGGGWQTR